MPTMQSAINQPTSIRKRHRLMLILTCVGLLLVGTVVAQEQDVLPVSANNYTCIAAILGTGVGVVALAVNPPAGIAYFLGAALTASGAGSLIGACQMPYLIQKVRLWQAMHPICGLPYMGTIFAGYRFDMFFHVYGAYVPAAGVGGGGGGGCSGSW